MGENNRESNKLELKVDVDVSDALVGLKAITREAREATRALKELEDKKDRAADNRRLLSSCTTQELHDELARRERVSEHVAHPHQCFEVIVNGASYSYPGPARILIKHD